MNVPSTETYPIPFKPEHGENPRRWLGWLVIFLVISGAQLGALIAFNVAMNPRREFPPHFVEPLTNNDVGTKVDLLAKLPLPPRALIVGSSRVMSLDPDDLTEAGHGSAFNFGLSSAIAGDMLAAYRWTADSRGAPRELILGVELEQFTAERVVRHDTRTSIELGPRSDEPLALRSYVQPALASLDPGYVEDSLTVARYALFGYPPSQIWFEPDGFRHYVGREEARRAGFNMSEYAAKNAVEYAGKDAALTDPAPRHLDALRKLVDEARDRGTSVFIVITPYHPAIWEAANGTGFADLESRFVLTMAGFCREGVEVHNFDRIESFSGDPSEFDDFHHYTEKNGKLLIQAMDADLAEVCRRA